MSFRYVLDLIVTVDLADLCTGLHFLSQWGRRFQADHSHEVGTSSLRHVDPRSVTGQRDFPRACTGCRKGSQDTMEVGESTSCEL